MPTYIVSGADRNTGEDVRREYTAPSAQDAEYQANQDGVMINHVEIAETVPPVPSLPPTPPPVSNSGEHPTLPASVQLQGGTKSHKTSEFKLLRVISMLVSLVFWVACVGAAIGFVINFQMEYSVDTVMQQIVVVTGNQTYLLLMIFFAFMGWITGRRSLR